MKNLTLLWKKVAVFLVVASLFSSADAYVILKYTRTKTGCFIGCAEVYKNKYLSVYTGENGKTKYGWVVNIYCKGIGLSHCPSMLASSEQTDVETCSANTFENLSNYAQTQVDLSNNTGNETYTYVLPDNSTRVLHLKRNTVVDPTTGEQTFKIDISQPI